MTTERDRLTEEEIDEWIEELTINERGSEVKSRL